MNILFFYHKYFDRGTEHGDTLRKLGHKVDFKRIKSKVSKKVQYDVKTVKKKNYDMVWFRSMYYFPFGNLDNSILEYCRENGIITTSWTTIPTNIEFSEWFDYYKKIDYLFFWSKKGADILKSNGINAFYLPFGYDEKKFYPMNVEKKYDISFAGSIQSNLDPDLDKRVEIIQELKPYNIVVFGKSFKKRLKGVPVFGFRTVEEQNRIYNQSKINLDIPYINSNLLEWKDEFHIKRRFFEVPGSRNFLLTATCDEFQEIYPKDMFCGYYSVDDMDSLKETIEYFIDHDKERNELSERAFFEVRSKHTYTNRIQEILNIIEQ